MNITVTFRYKVYKNLNSMLIICAMTILQAIRMITYVWRIFKNEWAVYDWAYYRIVFDWTNFMLQMIALVLIVQWHQTYRVLNNPIKAI